MRVAVFINSFNLGGAEKLMYDVAEGLEKKGIEVFLVSMKKAETEFEKSVFADVSKKIKNVCTIAKPVQKGRAKAVADIAKFLRKNKIEIAHTNGQSPDFYVRLAKLLYPKCKIVLTIHNTSGYSRKTEKLLHGFTAQYTAVSNQAAEYAKSALGIKKSVQVIINGVDERRYESGERKKGNKILSVGRVMKQKCYTDIAAGVSEYLKQNPDAMWDIIGDNTQDAEYYGKVSELVGDNNRVHFHGAVTNTEDYYKNASCFLLASDYEGFGIAFIEAMIARLPVICRKVGVIPEILEKGGEIVELDVQNVGEAIDKAQKVNAEALDKNRQICIENYSIEAVVDKYIKVYNSI